MPDAEVPESSRRERILAFVEANPGAYFTRIQRELALAPGETAHHLRVLEKRGAVIAVSGARYTHYFPARGAALHDRELLVALALERPRAILAHLLRAPRISSRELAMRLGTTEANLSWHLKRLRAAGLIDTQREGGAARHALVADPELVQRLLESYHPAFWRVWVARFAQTWGHLGGP